jgi:small subunit ribosomal protein S8
MTTDPIADLLTRIRNASKSRHEKTFAPYSRLKVSLLEVLKEGKFIDSFEVVKSGSASDILIKLNPELQDLNLKRISKPGQRIYIKKEDIKPVLNGYGISVVSTSKGIMSGEKAKKQGIGGELICEIW